MAVFRINFRKNNGIIDHVDISSKKESEARDYFKISYNHTITNVVNLTAESRARNLAEEIGTALSRSNNPALKNLALFSRPIAAVSATLLTQFKNILEGDDVEDIGDLSKRIINHIIHKKETEKDNIFRNWWD